MRASVMELLDSFAWDDAAVAAEAKRRFDAHWEDTAALPSEYKVSCFYTVQVYCHHVYGPARLAVP